MLHPPPLNPASALRRWLAVLLTALVPALSHAADDGAFARWEADIAGFEAADRDHPPDPGGIVFVGSSSIRLWDLQRDFPDLHILNRGFGGSQVADSAHFADRIVIPYRPRIVVLYAGDNDIAQGVTPCQVHEDFSRFARKVQAELPGTRIIYIAIKPSIKRWALIHRVRAANALIRATCAEDERLTFLDVESSMLGENGEPRPELFVEDGLHLSPEGYSVWADLLRPHLIVDDQGH
jgi:lysophospholipase L1-like esterase